MTVPFTLKSGRPLWEWLCSGSPAVPVQLKDCSYPSLPLHIVLFLFFFSNLFYWSSLVYVYIWFMFCFGPSWFQSAYFVHILHAVNLHIYFFIVEMCRLYSQYIFIAKEHIQQLVGCIFVNIISYAIGIKCWICCINYFKVVVFTVAKSVYLLSYVAPLRLDRQWSRIKFFSLCLKIINLFFFCDVYIML